MTKHIIICKWDGGKFQEQIDLSESKGWQVLPQTFSQWGDTGFSVLMFKVESNSPYRTEATHPAAPIPGPSYANFPLKK